MTKTQCISVTELRTKTKQCLNEAKKEEKYIFVNNKPVAVIINIDKYEAHFLKPELIELDNSQVGKKLQKEASAAKRTSKKDLIDI